MKTILLYYHTIRHLKLRQFIYQIWYRLKWNYFSIDYTYKNEIKFSSDLGKWELPTINNFKLDIRDLTFSFLNKSKTFNKIVDWNFSEFGKLWNYHLQYMDYLLNERIPVSERVNLLVQFSEHINSKKLKPEPFPISLRLTNVLIFVQKHFIQNEKINKAIGIQLSFLENNLEYHLLANHLLENYISLCFSFVVFNDEKKQSKYFKLLLKELEEQIVRDGGHYERTPAYHAQILIHLLRLVYLLEKMNQSKEVLLVLKNICSRMLGWYNAISLDGSQVPLFNDSAGSTTLTYSELQDMANHCNIKPEVNKLSDSGFRIVRNDDLALVVNCGNITPSYQPGHAHTDMLHFVLYSKGEAVLVDPGVSTYENIEFRLLEKSTRMHNTITVNDENQSQIWSFFRMAKRASVRILEESKHKLVAEVKWHNGVLHKRCFLLSNENLIIEDTIHNLLDQEELPKGNFHFDYLLTDRLDISVDAILLKDRKLKMQFSNHKQITQESYLQGEDFNKRNQAVKISVYFADYLKTVISWKH